MACACPFTVSAILEHVQLDFKSSPKDDTMLGNNSYRTLGGVQHVIVVMLLPERTVVKRIENH
jgi:hypothetical protein